MINFSISETSGKTFEIEKEDLLRIIAENDIQIDDSDIDDVSTIIHTIIGELGFDVLSEYEKANDYYEMNIEELTEV